MGKKLIFILGLLILSSSLLHVEFNPVEAKATGGYPVHNLSTGLNYTSIQEAINANETWDGHMIFVEEGTYYEHLVVNKGIHLLEKIGKGARDQA